MPISGRGAVLKRRGRRLPLSGRESRGGGVSPGRRRTMSTLAHRRPVKPRLSSQGTSARRRHFAADAWFAAAARGATFSAHFRLCASGRETINARFFALLWRFFVVLRFMQQRLKGVIADSALFYCAHVEVNKFFFIHCGLIRKVRIVAFRCGFFVANERCSARRQTTGER